MKTLLLAIGISVITIFDSQSIAQFEIPEENTITSLLPEDKKPVSFGSIEEQEKMVPIQIKECIKRINEDEKNEKMVKYYREMIWRLENSIISEISGSSK